MVFLIRDVMCVSELLWIILLLLCETGSALRDPVLVAAMRDSLRSVRTSKSRKKHKKFLVALLDGPRRRLQLGGGGRHCRAGGRRKEA
jgi:hypothetical protein